jgi:hypothetical protein
MLLGLLLDAYRLPIHAEHVSSEMLLYFDIFRDFKKLDSFNKSLL